MKTIAITSHIRCRVPNDWGEVPSDRGVAFRTPDGGTVTAGAREFQKPAGPGIGSGMTSEQMLSAQVAEFGQLPRLLAPGRAYASHVVPIGDPGQEVECRIWHLVNQAGAWHHETVMFSYEPAPDKTLDAAIVSVLDAEVPQCEFSRSFISPSTEMVADRRKPNPWWRFW